MMVMTMIDLAFKRMVIFGLPGSGKTELAKHILRSTPSHLVYDPMGEYEGFRRYQPTDAQDPAELESLIQDVVIPWKPQIFAIDEMNKFVQPKPSRLPPGIALLNDRRRHWLSWIGIARRPSQFHSDIVELASYLTLFRLPGRNDRIYLNGLYATLGDQAASLNKYEFLMLQEGHTLTKHAPVDIAMP